jgi:hypothetical protein
MPFKLISIHTQLETQTQKQFNATMKATRKLIKAGLSTLEKHSDAPTNRDEIIRTLSDQFKQLFLGIRSEKFETAEKRKKTVLLAGSPALLLERIVSKQRENGKSAIQLAPGQLIILGAIKKAITDSQLLISGSLDNNDTPRQFVKSNYRFEEVISTLETYLNLHIAIGNKNQKEIDDILQSMFRDRLDGIVRF